MTAIQKLAAELVNAKRDRDRLLRAKEKAEENLREATATHLTAAQAVNDLRDQLERLTDEAAAKDEEVKVG
jgi:hypothetical protein